MKRADKGKPFFLNVWFNEPHHVIASPPELVASYSNETGDDALYYANVSNMDAAIGRVIKALDDQGLTENTLILFTSDNGPWRRKSSGPLRAGKGSLYEGGIRVPGIVRWPGHVKPGTESDVPVGFMDLLPTILAITQTPYPADRKLDGANILPVLEGTSEPTREQPLFWFFYKSSPACAIRDGDYVLLADPLKIYRSRSHPIDSTDYDYLKSARMERFELYNLRDDPGQVHDLFAELPDVSESLKTKLLKIHRDVIEEGPSWPTLPSDAVN